MIKKMSLLDKMAKEHGRSYLSDLHYLDDSARLHLATMLNEYQADETSISEWNAALKYCTNITTVFSKPEEAKSALISALSTPDKKEYK